MNIPPTSPTSTLPTPSPKINKWYIIILIALLSYCTYLFFTDVSSAITLLVTILSVSAFNPPIENIFQFLSHLRYAPRMLRNRKTFYKIAIRIQRVYLMIVSLLILLIVLVNILPTPFEWAKIQYIENGCIRNPTSLRLCSNGLGIMEMKVANDTLNIGIIDERHPGPFDGSRNNVSEKDLEQRIFAENRRAITQPHITLALVTMLSRTVDDLSLSSDIGIEDLKGVYLAQSEHNADSNNKVKLRIVIANIGTRLTFRSTIPQVVRQIGLLGKSDPTLRGIVGFPFSQSAKIATESLKNLGLTQLPIISPSASSNTLSDKPNFYRVVSPDNIQSSYLANFIVEQFAPSRLAKRADKTLHIAVFSDNDDDYSESLKRSFMINIRKEAISVDILPKRYEVGHAETLVESVHDVVAKEVDAIFFSGYFDDLDILEGRLQVEQQNQNKKQIIPIFGGDGLYDLNSVALNKYTLIFSTTYAPPLKINDPFVLKYNKIFNNTNDRPYINTLSLIAPHAILSYDTTNAFLRTLIEMRTTTLPDQLEFNQDLRSITFKGISGLISFQGANTASPTISDPLNKPVYIMCADKEYVTRHAATYNSEKQKIIHLKKVLECKE